MNPDLDLLQPYPFERLNQLKQGVTPPADKAHIALSIGEPRHPAPAFVRQTLIDQLDGLSGYPSTKGLPELREAIAGWAERRFQLGEGSLDAETQVLPCNGTREALFAITQALIDRSAGPEKPLVVSPNPFYQIYEGAAYLAGAEPYFLDCEAANGYLPDFNNVPDHVWQRCQLLFICSPGNPTGAVIPLQQLQQLIQLADKHDFIIAADECYSEIYFDETKPPVGLLQACAAMGRADFNRCLVFHSLSKRSNLPGLRSGFVAGDASIMQSFLLYRTYHGCAMPLQTQHASIAAWNDEAHVLANRKLYRAKFDAVLTILDGVLDVERPDAGFYLWAKTPGDEQQFARDLFAQQHITVLPGSYLSRPGTSGNPGAGRVRMALVAESEQCIEAAQRIQTFIQAQGAKG